MYKPASHRHLKNRTLKRRVTSHHYIPKNGRSDSGEFACLRANQTALSKLKHKPELVVKVIQNIEDKQAQEPSCPHLQRWRQLLDALVEGECTIENISEEVLGYDKRAKQLRDSKVLDCLLD